MINVIDRIGIYTKNRCAKQVNNIILCFQLLINLNYDKVSVNNGYIFDANLKFV